MKLLKQPIFLGLLTAAAMAHAGGSARIVCDMFYPAIEVTYTTGADAGIPGLFWVGVLTQNQTLGAFYTKKGWEPYEGGLYPFHSRYDSGFQRTLNVKLPFPGSNHTTREYVGYTVYTGHGVYTKSMQDQVSERRQAYDSVKPAMVAKGMWRKEFDSDEFHMLALVQHDLTINKKYGLIYTIPFIDCNPSDGGGA